METIGKVLSITLLTIFGSAAATVYLVDSDVIPSFLGKPKAVYTSDTTEQKKPADFYNASYRRERLRINYNETEEETYDTGEYTGVKPIWGQSYHSPPSSSFRSEERALELARSNSEDSIVRNIEYWKDQYSTAVRAGMKASADDAFRNYSEYNKALDIIKSSSR